MTAPTTTTAPIVVSQMDRDIAATNEHRRRLALPDTSQERADELRAEMLEMLAGHKRMPSAAQILEYLQSDELTSYLYCRIVDFVLYQQAQGIELLPFATDDRTAAAMCEAQARAEAELERLHRADRFTARWLQVNSLRYHRRRRSAVAAD